MERYVLGPLEILNAVFPQNAILHTFVVKNTTIHGKRLFINEWSQELNDSFMEDVLHQFENNHEIYVFFDEKRFIKTSIFAIELSQIFTTYNAHSEVIGVYERANIYRITLSNENNSITNHLLSFL